MLKQKREDDENEDVAGTTNIHKKIKTCPFSFMEHEFQECKDDLDVNIEVSQVTNNDEEEDSRLEENYAPSISNNDGSSGNEIGTDETILKNEDDPMSSSNETSDCENREQLELSELEELLDADLPKEYKKPASCSFIHKLNERKKQDGDFVEVEKTILDDISGDHFDLLPEGWMQMMHNTGMPVYLNRPTRVCTLARPYFLGSGNIYNHKIPLSAIPCLQYRRVIDKTLDKLAQTKIEDCTRIIGNLRVPITKIETVYDNQRIQSLDANEVREYCQKLFKYKKVFIKRNESQKNRSTARIDQNQKFKNRPSLPAGTKLLSFIICERDSKGEVIRRREWIMNPSGKSYIAILHEYLQQSLKLQPVYQYKENI